MDYKARLSICRYGNKCKFSIVEASTYEQLEAMIEEVKRKARPHKITVTYLSENYDCQIRTRPMEDGRQIMELLIIIILCILMAAYISGIIAYLFSR